MSDWMIDLEWLGHCPNTVVECLSQETPVIYADSGGTKELVRDFGTSIKENDEYQFTLEDYDNPPMIDVTQLITLPDKNTLGEHLNIDINDVVRQYIELFEKVLS